VPAPLTDPKLAAWAREHLVYEVGMLMYTSEQLAARHAAGTRDRGSNALLESFVVHARCLSDFLWRSRTQANHEYDAFAEDFCADGVWGRVCPAWPPALDEAAKRQRPGREIAHLSYHRLSVPAAEKDWPVGRITVEIAGAVDVLRAHAMPARLDEETRHVLEQLAGPAPVGLSPLVAGSGATGMQRYGYRGGTIELSDFEIGS